MGIVLLWVKRDSIEPVIRVRLSIVPKPVAQLLLLFWSANRAMIPQARKKPQLARRMKYLRNLLLAPIKNPVCGLGKTYKKTAQAIQNRPTATYHRFLLAW